MEKSFLQRARNSFLMNCEIFTIEFCFIQGHAP